MWFERTQEELDLLRKKDAEAGRWHDDAGEPILYSPYGTTHTLKFYGPVEILVTSKRALWTSFARKPKGLCTGFCDQLGREVLFQKVSVK